MTQPKKDPIDVPAIGISVQHAIDETRQLVFQCHVGSDQSDKEINDLVDRLFKASNRQSAILRLPAARALLENYTTMRKRMAEDLVRVDEEAKIAYESLEANYRASGRKGEIKLSAQQQAHKNKNEADRKNAMTTLERVAQDIAKTKAEIARLEAQAKGD